MNLVLRLTWCFLVTGITIQVLGDFLRTGCEDREYNFAEVFNLFFCGKKFVIWGQNIISQIRFKKKEHPGLLFFIFWQVLE